MENSNNYNIFERDIMQFEQIGFFSSSLFRNRELFSLITDITFEQKYHS